VAFNRDPLSGVMAKTGIPLWKDKGNGYSIIKLFKELDGSEFFAMPYVDDNDDAVRGREISIEIGNPADIYIGADKRSKVAVGFGKQSKVMSLNCILVIYGL